MIVVFEWIGAICGIAGAALIASNVRLSPWGWWLFLTSSVSLRIYAAAAGAWGILSLNLCFVLTNLLGLIRVWRPYIRQARSSVPATGLQASD
jgi:nicotinamide riboside transporter PnuC